MPATFPARLSRVLALLCLVALTPACALVEDYIDLRYAPSVAPAPVAGAQSVQVVIATRDERTSNRERVSVKKNGYGMEMASIVATNDVVAEVGRVVELTLQGMGFQTGAERNGRVTVELHKLWNDFRIGFWGATAAAELSANVTVRDTSGRILYSRMHSVEANVPNVMIASGDNARLSLSQAFDRLAQRLQSDGELAQALLILANPSTGAIPPRPVPPVTPQRVIPRGGVPLS